MAQLLAIMIEVFEPHVKDGGYFNKGGDDAGYKHDCEGVADEE